MKDVLANILAVLSNKHGLVVIGGVFVAGIAYLSLKVYCAEWIAPAVAVGVTAIGLGLTAWDLYHPGPARVTARFALTVTGVAGVAFGLADLSTTVAPEVDFLVFVVATLVGAGVLGPLIAVVAAEHPGGEPTAAEDT